MYPISHLILKCRECKDMCVGVCHLKLIFNSSIVPIVQDFVSEISCKCVWCAVENIKTVFETLTSLRTCCYSLLRVHAMFFYSYFGKWILQLKEIALNK